MAHNLSNYERSISLDESSEYDTSEENHVPNELCWQGENTPSETDISRLKTENINRLHQRWDDIIAKYSKIDDSKESDEIDLHTGKIVTDNGHLRSFADTKNKRFAISSIWAVDDQFEKELRKHKHAEKIRRRLRHEEQERLKASSKFYNEKMQRLDVGAKVLPDNISLLSPSPTKKQRTNSSSALSLMKSSPTKNNSLILGYGQRLNTPETSPLKQKLSALDSSPNFESLKSPTRSFHRDTDTPDLEFNLHLRPRVENPPKLHFPAENTVKIEDHDDTQQQQQQQQHYEYDESFSFTEFPEAPPISFFNCAFYGCRYNSSSKASYREHLISSHSPELNQIGYPVQTRKSHNFFIPGDTIPKLNVHFPLKPELPPKQPHICGQHLHSGKCRKLFIDKKHLDKHRKQSPRLCSSRKQVLLCPLLGCEFMTDTSYHEFHEHMKSHDCARRDPRISSKINNIEEFDDEFSDSTSGLSISESGADISYKDVFLDNQLETSPSKRIKLQKSDAIALANVPKLNILDTGAAEDLGDGEVGEDKGYSSIDELFKDD